MCTVTGRGRRRRRRRYLYYKASKKVETTATGLCVTMGNDVFFLHPSINSERERVPVVVLEGAGDDPARGFGCGLPWPAAALGRPISHHESPVLRDRHQRRPPRRRPPAALPLPVLRGRPFPRLRRRRRRVLPQGSPAAGEFQEPHPPPFQINTSPLTLSPYIYYGRDSSSLLGMTKRPFLSRILFSPYLRLRSTVLAESLFPTLRSRSYIGSSP